MKRIFLSLPMSGRSYEEINQDYFKMVDEINKSGLYGNEDLIFDWNFDYNPEITPDIKRSPLLYLGHAIQKMAKADAIYMGDGWLDARGCQIEREVALKYGLGVIVKLGDGSIAVWKKGEEK